MQEQNNKEVSKKRACHPILAFRYECHAALYPSKEAKEPTVSKGGSANLRIDLLVTAAVTVLALIACGIAALRRRLRRS